MATLAASKAKENGFDPDGLILFAYPLHPPGKLDSLRDAHLPAITSPMLFLSGTRDSMAQVPLMEKTAKRLGKRARLCWVEGADHGFKVLKRSGRTQAQATAEAAAEAGRWRDGLL